LATTLKISWDRTKISQMQTFCHGQLLSFQFVRQENSLTPLVVDFLLIVADKIFQELEISVNQQAQIESE